MNFRCLTILRYILNYIPNPSDIKMVNFLVSRQRSLLRSFEHLFLVPSINIVSRFCSDPHGNTDAVAWRCSVKKVFLETSQSSQENTCAKVYFLIRLQA